jgi:hypothetical protein
MSYSDPAPSVESTEPATEADENVTDPAEVDPQSGTDEDDKPVENPAG